VNLRYTTRGLEENGGRSVTGTSVEDDVETVGAQIRKVGRGGCDKVETRQKCERYSRIEDVAQGAQKGFLGQKTIKKML